MKNFRKVLALILVVATLFSFVAMASAKSATEYTDYADVKNVEAVDVLTALGIINGYDGAFHPADTIDRDEMAKMIAVLRNAGDFDASLYASANKFADVKGQWAEGYVAYCAQLGIIAGQNATTFAPDDAVKAVDVAKMLLCVLGFDAQKQGYVGPNYQVAVLRDAAKFDIIPAGVDPYAPATRDTAAQMFLNALEAYMVVGYVGEGVVKMTNSLYVGNVKLPFFGAYDFGGKEMIDVSLYEAEKAGWEILSGTNAVISYSPLYEIYGGLKKTAGFDCYDRPGHVWTLTDAYGKVVFSKFYKAAPVSSTTTSTASAVVTAVASMNKVTKYEVQYYVDGANVNVDGFKAKVGNGSLIETFYYTDAAGKTYIMVCAQNTYIAEVGTVNTTYGWFTLIDNADNVIGKFDLTADLAAGDMVLYYLCDGAATIHGTAPNACDGCTVCRQDEDILHDIAVVEPVVAGITYGRKVNVAGTTTADKDASYIIADGKNYSYNFNYGYNYDTKAQAPVWAENEVIANSLKKYDLYLDAYGNLMYWVEHEDTVEYTYAYVVEKTATHVVTGTVADAVDPDGTTTYCADSATLVKFADAAGVLTAEKDQKINHAIFGRMAGMNAANVTVDAAPIGRLVRYSVNAKGAVVCDAVPGSDAALFAVDGARITKDSNVITHTNGTNLGLYTDNTTKFMVRTKNADGTYSYNEYVGYTNIPQTFVAETVANTNNGTNIQYFVSEDNAQFVTHVFVDAKYTTADASTFMLISPATYEAFDVAAYAWYKDTYTAYNALVDGVKSIVLVDDSMTGLRYGVLYKNTLQYLGLSLANDGGLPLYAQTTVTTPTIGQLVNIEAGIWTDATGAKWINVVDADKQNPYLPLAANAKLFTITFEDLTVGAKDDGKVNPTVNVFEGEKSFTDIPFAAPEYGYVAINTAGEVTAVYRVASTWYLQNNVGPYTDGTTTIG